MIINPVKAFESLKRKLRLNRNVYLAEVNMPFIRNMHNTNVLKDILSVQPMTGPVGKVFTMKIDQEDDDNNR